MNFNKLKPALSKEYFILLLPVFFVFHGYQQNFPSVPLSDALKLVLEYLLACLFLTLAGYVFFRSWEKAGLFSFVIMIYQFSFGWLHDLSKALNPAGFFSKYSFWLPVSFLYVCLAFFFFLRTKSRFTKLKTYLNSTILLLLLLDMFLLASKSKDHDKIEAASRLPQCDTCQKPNIYLIIADEYAGRKALKDLFSFDNSFFESELIKRGFLTVKHPNSNYNFTPYSMASIFSMDYLKGITDKSNDAANQNICYQNINKNKVTTFLKEQGYDFVNLSLFDFADKPGSTDGNNFYCTREKLISNHTLTGRIKKDLSYHLIATFKWSRAIKDYQESMINTLKYRYTTTINASGQSVKPHFIYTHFIMPHYPYLFDRNGKQLPFELSLQDQRRDLYLGFLEYCNHFCLSLVDSILKTDKTKPIIILMSDHGFTKYDEHTDTSYNFQNMINLYLPKKNYEKIPDSLCNINLFRVLLNSEFNQQLPLLENKMHFLKEY